MNYTLITGATSGIGEALAHEYANKGHHLLLVSRSIDKLSELKSVLSALYAVSIEILSCDFNKKQEVVSVFTHINSTYSIDCLINNAGIGLFEPIKNITLLSLENQENVNVIAPIIITSQLIEGLNANKGSLIMICSVLSYLPNRLSSVYVANKHALYGFSNSVRLEYPHLHVMTVHPATVQTDFFKDDYLKKVKRVLKKEQVAKAIYRAYQKKKRYLNLPKTVGFIKLIYQGFPTLIDWFNVKYFSHK